MRARGQWAYLYRTIYKRGHFIDFYITSAPKRFLGKVLNGLKDWEKPRVINTNKAPTYAVALVEMTKWTGVRESHCIDKSDT